jgi:4-hydroxyproline epimerase
MPRRIRVIDSHTAGEPTRVVLAGGPDLGDGPIAERLERFRARFDSFRSAAAVPVEVPGIGAVVGDIAWGGNWFFLAGDHGKAIRLDRLEELTDFTWRIRQALGANGITGAEGREIDHIELFGPPTVAGADSKNFVLCPGKAYDRSPCGTGTSAKLACLYAGGKLLPGQTWRQESIVGSVFEGSISIVDGKIYPEITGSAYINGEADLILDQRDPFCYGMRGAWR